MKKHLSIFIVTFLWISTQLFAANPTVTSATLSTNGRNITVALTATLKTFSPSSEIGNFTVTVNGTAISISGLSQPTDKSTFVINLGKIVNYGDVVTISYLGGNIVDNSNNPLVAFTGINVSNGTATPSVGGYLENFDDNILTGWGNDKNNDYTFDESNKVLNVSANYASAGYFPFSYTIPVNVDLTLNSTVTFTLTTAAPLDIRIDVQDSKGFTTNNTEVKKTGLTSGTYTYTFSDFNELYDSLGNKRTSTVSVDKTSIKRVLFYTNPGSTYSGSFSLDNLIIGTVPIAVTGINTNPPTLSLNIGANATLTAAITPTNATNKLVSWTSSDLTIATVASNGVVTGLNAGQVTINATSLDNKIYIASTTVTVTGSTTVDKSNLISEIAKATKATNDAVVGTQNGQYAQIDIDALNQVITNATTVNVDANATQQTVDAMIASLQAAETLFSSKQLSINKAALQSLIASAQKQSGAAVVGSSNGDYTKGAVDSLNTTINAAIGTNTTSTSQTEVDAMVKTLQASMDLFSSKVISIVVTKTALQAKIVSASQLKTSAVVGTHVGEYAQTNLNALSTAIANAQLVNNNTAATQTSVNDMVTTLQTAIDAFTATAVPSPDKTALSNALTTANNDSKAATAGNLVGQYPQTAIDALNVAITDASLVNTSTSANQIEVDAQTQIINEAISQFGKSINTSVTNFTVLSTAIDSANALKNRTTVGVTAGNVTDASMTALTTAINAAVTVNSNSAATQTDVNNAAATLSGAIDTFNASIIKSSTSVSIQELITIVAMPVPFSTVLNIKATNETIKKVLLYSITGSIVLEETGNSSTVQLSTKDVAQGLYIVSVELYNGETKRLKLVK